MLVSWNNLIIAFLQPKAHSTYANVLLSVFFLFFVFYCFFFTLLNYYNENITFNNIYNLLALSLMPDCNAEEFILQVHFK